MITWEAGDKWYEHEPECVLVNEDYKILWDFSIQTYLISILHILHKHSIFLSVFILVLNSRSD